MALVSNMVLLLRPIRECLHQTHPCTSEEHTVDDVIIWDPLTASSNLGLWCPFCAECSGLNRPLKATRWKDGKTTCDQPRHLYGLTNNAFLVSRVYVCDQRHQIIAHDPAVLSQVQGVFFIPFLLFHKVGITRELHGFIVSHANAGLTISEIQILWLQTMYDAYGLRRDAHLSACTANSKLCSSYPEFEQKFQNPGEKVIASRIAGNYLKKEHLYTKRMCQMTAEKWLSCDHTFKVSANVGFWLNKRWVKLYDTLFIILNEAGIVLSWKLCKGTNFLSVENILKLLKERLDRQGKNPTIFILDNCCSWRTKVTKVFPNIAVKLDPFHAMQRVIKRIPKKKGCTETITQLRRQMILCLKKIFCEPADKGEQRTMDTPSPEIILKNIDNFMRQWKTVEFNSILLLPSSAVHEIEKLKGHVTKGCLSGIPPSGGTNRNEALHRTLNKSLKRSRIGLELALAFLGLFFYKWNETKSRKSNKGGQRISYIQPVESYISTSADLLSENKEQFGGSLNTQELEEAAGCELSDSVCDVNQVMDCINSLLAEHSDNSDDNSFSSDDQDSNESDEEECGDSFNRVQIANVIQQALNFSCLSNYLKEIKGAKTSLSRSASHLVNLKNILCLFSSVESNSAGPSEGDLDEFLASNNMQCVKVPGDGNCFFVSLAIMIKQQLEKGILSAEGRTRLQQLGVIQGENFEINHIASAQRHVVVNEWLSNPSSYEPFLTSGQDYKTEANLFLQDGHFASELGNSMPLAASNALCLPIVVFTSMLNFPLLAICPQDKTVSDDPLYLVYDMSFAGHYDAAQQQVNQLDQQHQDEQPMTSTNQSSNQPQLSCRCGQGAKRKSKESIACREYKTGCKCFQTVSGCNMYCQCINCNNPYGKNVSGSELPCSSRKCRHHENSTAALKGKSFTEIKAGGTVAVQWTMFEELVLVELILGLLSRNKLEPQGLCSEYNYIVDTVRPTSMGQYLGKKTEKQVTRKLSTFLNSQKVFETLMKEQIRINLGDS